jgi:hypothetical protein
MNRVFLSLVLVIALTGCSRPDNFAECIVEDMQGVQNQQVFGAIYKSCRTKFPKALSEIEKGSGRGLFSYKNREECVVDNAKDTTFPRAAMSVAVACACLYDEPKWQGQKCS